MANLTPFLQVAIDPVALVAMVGVDELPGALGDAIHPGPFELRRSLAEILDKISKNSNSPRSVETLAMSLIVFPISLVGV